MPEGQLIEFCIIQFQRFMQGNYSIIRQLETAKMRRLRKDNVLMSDMRSIVMHIFGDIQPMPSIILYYQFIKFNITTFKAMHFSQVFPQTVLSRQPFLAQGADMGFFARVLEHVLLEMNTTWTHLATKRTRVLPGRWCRSFERTWSICRWKK